MADLIMTEAERLEHIAARVATIERAIAWIEKCGPEHCSVIDVLSRTSIHQHLKSDPDELVRKLRECTTTGHTFGAWKAAQQICKSAGLEY